MKTFTMADHFRAESKECIVGPSAVGSRSAYLVFGEVQPGQVGKLSAGHGHEEILLVIAGRARIVIGGEETVCGEGQGVYLGVEPSGELRPEGGQPVRYVCSGGHIPGTHSH